MGPAEWLLVLTCAGYVAPYAWDRLRAEWRSWSTPTQVDTSGLRAALAIEKWDGRLMVVPESTSTLRKSICYETIQSDSGVVSARIAGAWCAPATPGYVFTSGDENCRTCVNTRTMKDRRDRYECTGDCLPVEKPEWYPAGTF